MPSLILVGIPTRICLITTLWIKMTRILPKSLTRLRTFPPLKLFVVKLRIWIPSKIILLTVLIVTALEWPKSSFEWPRKSQIRVSSPNPIKKNWQIRSRRPRVNPRMGRWRWRTRGSHTPQVGLSWACRSHAWIARAKARGSRVSRTGSRRGLNLLLGSPRGLGVWLGLDDPCVGLGI